MKSTFGSWYSNKVYATPELTVETNEVETLLEQVQTIAIVGISSNATKDSHYVGRYLKQAGYKIVPVNPGADTILGETCYPSLSAIPFPVDVIDVFRRPDHIPAVVEEAITLSPKIIWLQLGTGTHNEFIEPLEAKGVRLIQNRCIKVDHQFLIRPKAEAEAASANN